MFFFSIGIISCQNLSNFPVLADYPPPRLEPIGAIAMRFWHYGTSMKTLTRKNLAFESEVV